MKTKFFITAFLISTLCFAQDKCENTEELISIIEQNYREIPADGAKYVFVNGCKYLIGVGTASTKSKGMSRIAKMKADRAITSLIHGTNVTSQTIMTTEEIISDDMVSFAEAFKDEIQENSNGHISGMPMLTTFKSSNGETFIYVIFKAL